jgi:hypothetical protein
MPNFRNAYAYVRMHTFASVNAIGVRGRDAAMVSLPSQYVLDGHTLAARILPELDKAVYIARSRGMRASQFHAIEAALSENCAGVLTPTGVKLLADSVRAAIAEGRWSFYATVA